MKIIALVSALTTCLAAWGTASDAQQSSLACAGNLSSKSSGIELLDCLKEVALEVSQREREIRYLQSLLVEATQNAVPSGAVLAFDIPSGCPKGWNNFPLATGRFIVGAGLGNFDENKVAIEEKKFRDEGGAERVTLNSDQIAAHTHRVPHGGADTAVNIEGLSTGVNWGVRRTIANEETLLSGGSQPHNNMPPYIALHFCKKD